jgi:chromosome segregation ATPase
MENNTQITIEKLQDAINTLLDAYENLQEENNKNLETIKTLEEEKAQLEATIDDMEDNSGKQNGAIGSMIGKIESILGNPSKATEEVKEDEDKKPELVQSTFAITSEEEEQKEESSEENKDEVLDSNITKIDDIVVNPDRQNFDSKNDLDSRMAKLLGGFN